MAQKIKLTAMITNTQLKTIQAKAEKIAKITHDDFNLSLGLRAILDEYADTK